MLVKQNPHDFGTYLNVNCSFDPDDKAAVEYAFRCEREFPRNWDDDARAYLDSEGKRRGERKTNRKEVK